MVCYCSLARQKNTTSAFVCSWFLSLSYHNQQKPPCHKCRDTLKRMHTRCLSIFLTWREIWAFYLQTTPHRYDPHTGHARCHHHGSRMYGQTEGKHRKWPYTPLSPLISTLLSAVLSQTAHPLHIHSFCISPFLLILPFVFAYNQMWGFHSCYLSSSNLFCPTIPLSLPPFWHPWLPNTTGSWCLQELKPHSVERAYNEKRGFVKSSIVPCIHAV